MWCWAMRGGSKLGDNHIVNYIRYLVERGETVALGKRQTRELIEVLDERDRLIARVEELELELVDAMRREAEAMGKYVELLNSEEEQDDGQGERSCAANGGGAGLG